MNQHSNTLFSPMLTNLTAEVRDFRIDNFWQPLLEAITNSLQANATEVKLKFFKDEKQGELLGKKINAFEIEDNGDGFNQKNRDNFKQLKATKFSQDEEKKGCKGMGRLSYLKVFKEVEILSFTGSEKIEFKFTEKFDHTSLNPAQYVSTKSTKISFKNPTENIVKYENGKLKKDKRGELNLEAIRQTVLNHLLPILFFKKNARKDFKIIFSDGDIEKIIVPEDVPDFKDDKTFELANEQLGEQAIFTLLYNIADTDLDEGIVHTYYCANQRAVCEFSKKGVVVTAIPRKIITFLLVSDFFDRDDTINDTRQDFYINHKEVSTLTPFNWDNDINPKLKEKIVEVLSVVIPKYEEKKKEQKVAIIKKRPYLAKYVLSNDAIGILDEKEEIKNAQKAFNKEKNACLELIDSGNSLNEQQKEKLKDALSVELSEYMWLRFNRLKDIKKLLDNKELNEGLIHNLFLPKGTELDEDTSLIEDIHKNNLWLIDDRFMSYRYAFSDKKIAKIKEKIKDENQTVMDSKEPDFMVVFDELLKSENDAKGVAVELKSFGCSDDEIIKGITQLTKNRMAFGKSEKVKEFYYYLIANVSQPVEEYLKADGFKEIFSTSGKIFFSAEKNSYVLPIETVVNECEKRHEIFFKILQKQFSEIL
jgi:hypothetical protein